MPPPLSADDVRKVARLSRLTLSDTEVEDYRAKLAAVIGYIDRLNELDLTGVEPLTNVADTFNRFGDDEPGPTLSNATLMKLAPQSLPPFVSVPKVIDAGGGA